MQALYKNLSLPLFIRVLSIVCILSIVPFSAESHVSDHSELSGSSDHSGHSDHPDHSGHPEPSEHSMAKMMGPSTLWQTPRDCGDMAVWDIAMAMCMPLAMPDMPMRMWMLHGNIFGTRVWQTGPRSKTNYASTSMVMGDLGTSIGDRHYLNLDLMLTAEKWTLPSSGYPLLLQIGEHNQQGVPYIDAQHPHSSPIMGLTFSDTITLNHDKDFLKLFFAPRGEATDGPVAFMHRATGLVNPDAPLGHHIGQDVSHITSTVFGTTLKLGETRFEVSTYFGAEPSPDQVDLPLGTPDSFSLRIIRQFSKEWILMGSFGRVKSVDHDDSTQTFRENRYSASGYAILPVSPEWTFYNTLIYGLVTQYDRTSSLSSFSEEFLFRGNHPRVWGRIEVLQRTPAELAISSLDSNTPFTSDLNPPQWIAALTLGYSHKIAAISGTELDLGGSVTHNLLPDEFISSYGGNPWSGRIFIQLGGMEMNSF